MSKEHQGISTPRKKRASANILMVDLLSAVYWFDEALQAGLAARGWSQVTRIQSMVLANIASGTHRATQLARNLGVSRQAMSQTLAEMEARGLVRTTPDPEDKRALVVGFSDRSAEIRDDAMHILRKIEKALADRIGKSEFDALKAAAAADWGPSPVDAVTETVREKAPRVEAKAPIRKSAGRGGGKSS